MHGGTQLLVSPAMEVDADTGPTLAVPSAVGVPGEQTVWLRLIAAAVGQGQLENLRTRADVQVLLQGEKKKRERGRQRTDPAITQGQKPERDEKQGER